MISEVLLQIETETINLPINSRSLNFDAQPYDCLIEDGVSFIKFYGAMSEGMEYFIEREMAHKERLLCEHKKREAEKIMKSNILPNELGAHYSLPTITTPSESLPE